MKRYINFNAIKTAVTAMAVALFVMGASQAMAADDVKAVVGEAAPEFTLVDSHGETHSLSHFKGKTVVLEWTNHECPYVQKHYDTNNMQNLQQEATGDGVIWLTINSSAPGMQGNTPAEEANMLIEKIGSHETARLLDHDGNVGHMYGARTTPHMFVINGEGTLVYAGAIDDNPSSRHEDAATANNYVRAALASVKSGEPVETAQTQPYGCGVKYKL